MKDFQIQQLISFVDALPEPKRSAMLWLIANHEIAISICKEKPLTHHQRKQYTDTAIHQNDMYFLALVLLESVINA